jgi:perosamine synthetase
VRNIPFGKPIIGEEERQAVNKVLSGTTLTHGPLVREFEDIFARFTGAKHAIAVSSCTAALHLASYYLELGPQDEVILPAQTHVAAAHAVELVGARPVFVDSETTTGNIDIDRLETRINDKTRALSVVHYLGMPVDMHRIMEIARKHGLFVIEDCALALGTYLDGVHAGLFGDVGCFSFYPVKHITTAEGGMAITGNEEVAAKLSRQRAFGIDRNIISERPIPGVYDVPDIGLNYRLSEIGAALGIKQMKRLDGFLESRRRNYVSLSKQLGDIGEIELLQSSHDGYLSSCYCLSAILKPSLVEKRFEIVKYLNEHGVGTSIYYPQAVPLLTYYRHKYSYNEGDFPVAARLSAGTISLPVGPHVEDKDISYMVSIFKDAITEVKK